MMKVILACVLPAVAMCQLIGGVTDTKVDVSDPLVTFAVDAANTWMTSQRMLGADQKTSDVKVIQSRTQVVAGQNLFLTLLLDQRYLCNVTVWSRPWLSGPEATQATSTKCIDVTRMIRRRALMAGGQTDAAPLGQNAPQEVTNALSSAVCAVNDQSNGMFMSILDSSKMASVTYTQQVTAGMTYRFYNVPMVETTCRKSGACADMSKDALMACPVNNNGMAQSCTLTVQWQAWMDPAYTVSNIQC